MPDGRTRSVPKAPPLYRLPPGWAYSTITKIGESTDTGGSLTFTTPTGTRAGDLMICASSTRNSTLSDPSNTSGAAWTEVYHGDTSSNEWIGCWWKICNSSEDATISHSMSSTGSGGILVLRREESPFTTAATVGSFDTGIRYSPAMTALDAYAGGVYVAIWQGCYNGGSHSNHGDLTHGFYVKQSSDELNSTAYRQIPFAPESGYFGVNWHSMGDGGYLAACSLVAY